MNIYTRVKRPLFYLDGDTGTRKSSEVFKHIVKNSKFRNQILISNKTTLLDEAEDKLKKLGAKNVRKYHTYDDHTRNEPVMKSVNNWFQNYCSDDSPNGIAGAPSILLCTEYALKNAKTLMTINGHTISTELTRAMKSQADLWIDELPEVHEEHRVKVHNQTHVVKDWIELDYKVTDCKTFVHVWNDDGSPKINKQGKQVRTEQPDSMWAVRANNPNALKQELESNGHTYGENEYALLSSALDTNQQVYTRKSRWDSIGKRVRKNQDTSRGETLFQSFFNRKLFVGWNNLTVISADYQHSFLKDWMKDSQNFQLAPQRWIKRGLLNGGVHPLFWSNRARIVHCFDRDVKQKNSKNYQKHHSAELCNKIYRELEKMGFPPFLLCTNNDRVKNHKLAKLPGCKLVSVKDMGSNEFQKYHVVVFDAALNHKPDTEADLKLLGVTDETIYNHMVLNPLYQITSRTSLRDEVAAKENTPVTIFCMEETSANALAGRFASSNIGASVRIRHIDEDEYQLVPVDPVDTTNTSEIDGITPTPIDSGHEGTAASPMCATRPCSSTCENGCDPVTTGNCTKSLYLKNIVQPNGAKPHDHWAVAGLDAYSPSDGIMHPKETTVSTKFDLFEVLPNKKSRNYVTIESDLKGFVKYLKNTKDERVTNQDAECARIARCVHGPDNQFSHAFAVPMVFSGGITFTMFNGVFNPQRQNKAKGLIKHSYVIYTTFEGSKQNPSEFQVWLFLDRPASNEHEYEAIRRYVKHSLEQAGYSTTGLQPMNEHYWAPCVNANHNGEAYFKAINVDKTRQVEELYGVNPVEVGERFAA